MTLGEFRIMTRHLPPDLEIMIPDGLGFYVQVFPDECDVVDVGIDGETQEVLVIGETTEALEIDQDGSLN